MRKKTGEITKTDLLIIKIRSLGDTLLATPAMRALRRAYPAARIAAVVSAAGASVLQDNPDLDQVWVYGQKSLPYALAFILKLRQAACRTAVALHASYRTALLAWASGAPCRVVHNHSGRNWFGSVPILARKESKSAIQRDLDAVRALGLPVAGEELTFPLRQEHYQGAQAFVQAQGLDAQEPFWVLAPGAGKECKRWTAAEAILFLNAATASPSGSGGFRASRWIVLAGNQDQELARAISRGAKSHPPVFQRTIKEAGALMSLARGVVTADSGPKHVAVAVGARTLTLWTNEPEAEWHPYDCKQHALVRSKTGVVADISAGEVLAAFRRHLL
ncbi:glycosyltransferase family 9 protein [candidate division FCPU426 bacterium]|nr:glycosyltransferase family 9 protein [candidate division FCPU426 bacterium]